MFADGKPDKNEYRKFKIRTIEGANDVGMMQEVMRRRLKYDGRYPIDIGRRRIGPGKRRSRSAVRIWDETADGGDDKGP